MRPRRAEDRVTKRYDVRFHIGGETFHATTSNLSPHGVFIRTRHSFKAGAKVRVEIAVSEQDILVLEGFVRRAVKSRLVGAKDGMGVEVPDPDVRYLDLVRNLEI